ncbi:GNAT family N-acetyltransferase [Sphingobium sp.]|jgi:DNA-binding MarR family transcriptional regulator/N-acetylglutamate synthase-like GNAT family acetyltransferase|uniref:bifunctional helix-turn-helix transcriptional regulator/GNAT family N-acetyltransferase n=1 Tax=Sphingobium sp. TaxID=1912891 RepID=UPI00257CF8B2|nr:GNAT family N-acetyltransferase [Sphingobium sp.]MBR2270091.1 MarR family transcriptional regulator/GNAT family N-acetyltransferase [Sphingobium sp.]
MDVIREGGIGFLGSRLKRLGERMQAGAARVTADAGLPVQPAHMAFLAALDGEARTVGQLVQAIGVSQPGVTRAIGQLVDLGLVRSEQGEDQRQRTISLTPEGMAVLARARVHVWPPVEDAVRTLLGQGADAFMAQIIALETALAETPLDMLAAQSNRPVLTIREYSDDLAHHFAAINAEWINGMFHLEAADRAVLDNPRERIIDAGGTILFVEARGLGIVGTGALQPSGDGGLELTKMGVRANARGLKAGEFLLSALIKRARTMDGSPFYLLTNSRCSAAIHLYEKLGFRHDAKIMARYGARYERCDVAMRYPTP